MRSTFIMFILVLLNTFAFSQTPVDVNESTVKVGGMSEQDLYYGFEEGDQIVFNFEEVNGKELKEIEILEYPSSSKFMDYKSKKVENKIIQVQKTGVYEFRFSNSAIGGRICKYKIQRIPASDATKNFDTNVYWKTVFDTTYTVEQENYLVKSDTAVVNLKDQLAKVHSTLNFNGNTTPLNFSLPPNTISWSYYIGVDQAGQLAFQKAADELAKNAAPIIAKIPGYGPLAALALNATSYLSKLQEGENVKYYIVEGGNNANLFSSGQPFNYIITGNVINDYSRMLQPLQGDIFFCLSNDNAMEGISVTVKVTAVTVTQQWGTRPVKKMSVASRQEPYLKNS